MRHFVALTSAVVLAFAVSGQKTAIQTAWISKVEKDSSLPAIERFAEVNYDIIVTHTAPDEALTTREVTLPQHRSLAFVELINGSNAKLPSEIVRFDRLAFIEIDKETPTEHMHFGDVKNHTRAIDLDAPAIEIESHSNHEELQHLIEHSVRSTHLISKETLMTWLQEFSGDKPFNTQAGSQRITERGSDNGRKLARQWLAQKYTALGFTVSEHNYGGGTNFIAEKVGKDSSKVFIVSAHLDSMNNPGADDDGAGTISTLAVATVLSQQNLKYNLRIVGFDQEEKGLIGSKAYAKKLKDNNTLSQVIGVLNLEMTGYDNDKDSAFHAIHCNKNQSKTLADALLSAIKTNQLGLKLVDACTNRSDHASFWQYGVPAIVVAQNFFGPQMDSNPCYHKSCDKVDKVNWDYMQRLTAAASLMAQDLMVAP